MLKPAVTLWPAERRRTTILYSTETGCRDVESAERGGVGKIVLN